KYTANGFEDIWIDNYSSFSKKILRKHYLSANIPKNFEVISGFEEKFLLDKILNNKTLKLNVYENTKNYSGFIKSLVDVIDLIKLRDKKFLNTNLMENNAILKQKFEDIKTIYSLYKQELEKYNFLDYKDLLIKTTELFERPQIVDIYKNKFKYIFIDDLEEITHLEYKLVLKLCYQANNIISAANPNGSIYKFRGADPKNLLPKIEKELNLTKIYLNNNKKNTPPETNLKKFVDLRDEIYWIGQKIRELILKQNYEFNDFVIIRRTFENNAANFRELRIPFYIHGRGGIFDNPLIKNLILYLKTLNLKNNNKPIPDDWLIRTICLGNKNNDIYLNFYKLINYAKKQSKNLFWILEQIHNNEIPELAISTDVTKIIKIFFEIMEKHKESKLDAVELIFLITDKYNLWNSDLNKDIDLINIFYKTAIDFNNLRQKLYNEKTSLEIFIKYLDEMLSSYSIDVSPPDKYENVVRIMTVQQMKGKTSKILFFSGVSENIIPRIYKENKLLTNNELDLLNIAVIKNFQDFYKQEEHIFDLGISRAKEKLYISYSENCGTKKNLSLSSFITTKNIFSKQQIDELKTLSYKNKYSSDASYENIQTKQDLRLFKIMNKIENPKINIIKKSYAKKFIKILTTYLYSASSIKLFKNCPYKFLFAKLLKLDIEKNINFVYGNIIHKILYEFHKQCNHHTHLNNSNLEEKTSTIINNAFQKNINEFQGTGELRWCEKKAENLMTEYIKEIREDHNDWEILHLEKSFQINISEFNIIGRIDRIDKNTNGEIEIIDYKTGKHKWTSKGALAQKIKEGEEIQLLIYYLLLRNTFKDKIKKLSYFWLEKETKGAKKSSIELDEKENLEALAEGEQLLLETIKKMQKNISLNINSYNCRECAYTFLCGM
ncbi:PD-(D/E)XK nuclease family protein, partial [bacterium]